MNELKHNAFLKLNASLPECRSLERHSLSFLGRSGNSVSHSPWVVRQVALETQHNAFLWVALWSQVIEIKEIEYITVAHNNLTGTKNPVRLQCSRIRPNFLTLNLDFITKSHLNKKH